MLMSDVRYKLVCEALRERHYFLEIAPHLSTRIPIMLPVDTWWKIPLVWSSCLLIRASTN
jgi:glycerol-3-phosphate dehydrogenase